MAPNCPIDSGLMRSIAAASAWEEFAMATTHDPLGNASLSDLPLARALGDNWWILLLRGLAAILFGVLAYAWPGLTLLTLVLLWGVFAAADGILALIGAFSGSASPITPRWWLILVGLCGVAAGAIAFVRPDVAALALLLIIALWAIVVGVSQIIGGIALRKEMQGEWMLILSGFVNVLFGGVLIAQPAAGALAIIWVIGFFSILSGLALIMLSFKVKRLKAG
jgi:uncharacterized membrane protein HdeD (DUF308 family)